MKTLLRYPLLNPAFLVKYALLMVLAIGLLTPSVHAQTDTLPVSIQSKDRAGLQDPGMARVKTSAIEFAAALSPIFNGTVSLRVDDEIMYPLNRYENQGIFAQRFATRAADYDRDVAVARARPQLRSDLAGSSFILAVRQMTGDGLAMQVRFKVKLPAIEGLSVVEQTKLEGDLAAAGEKAAAGGSGGLAVAKGIDAMRVILEVLDELEETPGYRYKIVDCPPGNYGNYFVTPSGAVVSPPAGANFVPYYYDNVKDWPRGTLASFSLNGDLYVGIWRPRLSIFDAYVKKEEWDKLLSERLPKKEAITLKELKDKGIIYTGFRALDIMEYNITTQIINGGTLQTYNFKYTPSRTGQVTGPKISGSIIPETSTSICNFCNKYINSPGFKYFKEQSDANSTASQEQRQLWCDQAKAFNNLAGEVATEAEFDVAYWENVMRAVYGQTLPTMGYDQTHADYIAGLYAFANWYKSTVEALNTIDDQRIMALSIMWLPDEVIRRLDCGIRKNIIDVLLSDALTGKTLFTNVDRRGALMKLFALSETDGVCILKYLIDDKFTPAQRLLDQYLGIFTSGVGQQDAIALAILGLPPSVIKGLDCKMRGDLIDILLLKNLKGEDFFTSATRGSDRAAFIKLLESSGDKEQAKCVYDKLAGDCTKLQTLLNSFSKDQAHFSQFASAFKSISAIAMSSWSKEKIQDNFKGQIMHVGYLGYRCPSDPYIKLDVTITGCQVNVKYSMPNGFKIVPIGGTDGVTSECFEPIEWSKPFDFFELIVVIPTGNVPEFGWKAGESHVVPAYMLAYLSKKQDNEIKEAASKVGFTVLNIAFVLGTLGEGTVLELGAIQAATRSLAVMAASGEITTVLAEKQIRDLFKDPAAAQEFINTLHEISLFFLSADALVSVTSAIRNVEKADLLFLKAVVTNETQAFYLRVRGLIANLKIALEIGDRLATTTIQQVIFDAYVYTYRLLSSAETATQLSITIAKRLVDSGKGREFLKFMQKEFYSLYATKGEAVQKLLLSLIDRKWDKPELFAELVADLAGNGKLLGKLVANPNSEEIIIKWILLADHKLLRQDPENFDLLINLFSRISGSPDRFKVLYSELDIQNIIESGRKMGLDNQTIEDMLFVGSRIDKPINSSELIQQMYNWLNVVQKRGYPFLFNSLGRFEEFKTAIKSLLQRSGIPFDDVIIQGSSLRSASAKDIDIAVFVSKNEFDVMVEEMITGIRSRTNENQTAGENIIRDLKRQASDGRVSSFYFNRSDGAVKTFNQELYEIINLTDGASGIDLSLMIKSTGFDMKPNLKL